MWVTNSKAELMPIIQGKILEGSAVHTECWKAYDGLILNGSLSCLFISEDEFARGKCHVNPSGPSQRDCLQNSMD